MLAGAGVNPADLGCWSLGSPQHCTMLGRACGHRAVPGSHTAPASTGHWALGLNPVSSCAGTRCDPTCAVHCDSKLSPELSRGGQQPVTGRDLRGVREWRNDNEYDGGKVHGGGSQMVIASA